MLIGLAALQILSCGKQLQVWSGKAGATTYYDMIARDKEIVKVVLLLTGSIEGTKESVLEYISSFDKYKFLWQKDLATEYAAFMSTSPSLEVWQPVATCFVSCPHSPSYTNPTPVQTCAPLCLGHLCSINPVVKTVMLCQSYKCCTQ